MAAGSCLRRTQRCTCPAQRRRSIRLPVHVGCKLCICKQLAQPHVPPRPHTCPGRPACMPARHTRSASSASGAGHARPASAVRAPASAPPAPLDIAAQSHFVLVMSRPPPCLHIVHKYSA